MKKICARCDETIEDGEEFTEVINHSGSGAAPNDFLHKELCKKTPRQTYPETWPDRFSRYL